MYGPPGIDRIAEGVWIATGPDRDIRVADNEIDPEHMRIIPHEYEEGVVYDRGGLVVRAIKVDHGDFIDIAMGSGSNMAAEFLFTAMTQDTMKT